MIGISFPPVADAAQRQFTIEALRPLNVQHIRFAENWRRRGMTPDFAPLVRRVEALHDAGLQILLTVQSDGPDAACAERNAHSCLIKPDAPFEIYLSSLLASVGDKIDAIQFGNEWDSQFVGTTDEFLTLHGRFAQVVRAERPSLPIVLGGVTGRAAYYQVFCLEGTELAIEGVDVTTMADQFCNRDAARNQAVALAVQKGLAQADYDIADIHLYDVEDLWPAAVDWFTAQTQGRPVWITEFGGPTPRVEPDDPAYQAMRLRAYLETVAGLPVERAYYFKLTDDDSSVHQRSGLYDRRGREKPARAVFETFVTGR
ncbi:MAG: glycosyl hydrolase [Yoonia sp.]